MLAVEFSLCNRRLKKYIISISAYRGNQKVKHTYPCSLYFLRCAHVVADPGDHDLDTCFLAVSTELQDQARCACSLHTRDWGVVSLGRPAHLFPGPDLSIRHFCRLAV